MGEKPDAMIPASLQSSSEVKQLRHQILETRHQLELELMELKTRRDQTMRRGRLWLQVAGMGVTGMVIISSLAGLVADVAGRKREVVSADSVANSNRPLGIAALSAMVLRWAVQELVAYRLRELRESRLNKTLSPHKIAMESPVNM